MATFNVPVVRLTIEEHPNADVLELARVDGYVSIVPKGVYKTGDLAVYIPEQSVVPGWILIVLGLEGRLAGKQRNRVKAIKLRKILSQGLIYPVQGENTSLFPQQGDVGSTVTTYLQSPQGMLGVSEGDDVSDFLGITKYVPVIPSHMHGVVINAFGYTINYDIENYKNYPTALNEDVQVVMTEKLHGTWACFGYHPAVGTIVTSKGLSSRGLIFQLDDGVNDNNLYVQALMRTGDDHDGVHLVDRLRAVFGDYPIYVMGEVFGKGIQDLQYGSDRPQFRGFDVYVGAPGTGFYMDFVDKVDLFNQFGVGVVPILYVGSFSSTKVEELTTGKETVSGTSACIREGLVITPMVEMRSPDFGRLVLKSVSAQYLLRDGDDVTEYN